MPSFLLPHVWPLMWRIPVSGQAAREARSASSSLPRAAKSSNVDGKPVDQWDWGSFMEAYARGQWCPFKIPTPPMIPPTDDLVQHSTSRSRFSLRPGSSSAPSSSVSVYAPRPSTPPAISTSVIRAEAKDVRSSSYTSPRPPKLQLPTFSEAQARAKASGGPVLLPSPRLESAPQATSKAFTRQSSARSLSSHDVNGNDDLSSNQGDSSGLVQSTRRKPFMDSKEFAATVRLAGASSNLAPLSLPSPDYEHVDPLRAYSKPGESSISTSSSASASSATHHHHIHHHHRSADHATQSDDGGKSSAKRRTVPRKSKTGRVGLSWTASAGGLLPSEDAESAAARMNASRLAVIPGTPTYEGGPAGTTTSADVASSAQGSHPVSPPLSLTSGSDFLSSRQDHETGGLHLPMATAPLPETDARRDSRKMSAGEDYFGEPKLWTNRNQESSHSDPALAAGGNDEDEVDDERSMKGFVRRASEGMAAELRPMSEGSGVHGLANGLAALDNIGEKDISQGRRGSTASWEQLFMEQRRNSSAGSGSSSRTVLGRGQSYSTPSHSRITEQKDTWSLHDNNDLATWAASAAFENFLSAQSEMDRRLGQTSPLLNLSPALTSLVDKKLPLEQASTEDTADASAVAASSDLDGICSIDASLSSLQAASTIHEPRPTHNIITAGPRSANLPSSLSSHFPRQRPTNSRSSASSSAAGGSTSMNATLGFNSDNSPRVGGSMDVSDYLKLGYLPAPQPPNERERRKALYRFVSHLHSLFFRCEKTEQGDILV